MIDCQSTFTGNVGRKIDWKSVGVVQFEDNVPGNFLALEFGDRTFEDFHALIERLCKALLFFLEHSLNVHLRLNQLGIGLTHFTHEWRNEIVEKQCVVTELLAVSQCATN